MPVASNTKPKVSYKRCLKFSKTDNTNTVTVIFDVVESKDDCEDKNEEIKEINDTDENKNVESNYEYDVNSSGFKDIKGGERDREGIYRDWRNIPLLPRCHRFHLRALTIPLTVDDAAVNRSD